MSRVRIAIQLIIMGVFLLPIVAAICGAFIALLGGIFGVEYLKAFGGRLAGEGPALFFYILLSPVGKLLVLVLAFTLFPQWLSRREKTDIE